MVMSIHSGLFCLAASDIVIRLAQQGLVERLAHAAALSGRLLLNLRPQQGQVSTSNATRQVKKRISHEQLSRIAATKA